MKNIKQFINEARQEIKHHDTEEREIIGIAIEEENNSIIVNFLNERTTYYYFKEIENSDIVYSFEQVYEKLLDYVGKEFTENDLNTIRREILEEDSDSFVINVCGISYVIE